MNPFIQLKPTTSVVLIVLMLACFGFLAAVQGVVPAPDGGYPGGNTAEGQAALLSLTTGTDNTAVGFLSLRNDTTASFNTAIGAGTLLATSTGGENTATGAGALLSNTAGSSNTANGAFALVRNTTGNFNTASGDASLVSNTTGSDNTAVGNLALGNNTTGDGNTALGHDAGVLATIGSGNVYIGEGMEGVAGESNACYIASIFGQTSANGIPVLINSSSKLGTITSSKRFKEDIKPMAKASEALFALKPVTFHYKKEIDPAGTWQLGLVAEDVERVNPDLVVRDKDGKPYSVRYDQVNAMLLNEFLKEHQQVKDLKAIVAEQQKQIERLTSGLQEVKAQVETSRLMPGLVVSNQ